MDYEGAALQLKAFVDLTDSPKLGSDRSLLYAFAGVVLTKGTDTRILEQSAVVEPILDELVPSWRNSEKSDPDPWWIRHRKGAIAGLRRLKRRSELSEIVYLGGKRIESTQHLPETATVQEAAPPFLEPALTTNTRPFVTEVHRQINETYRRGCYDACYVMIRRLLETLIIECFEKHGLVDRIKQDGNFVALSSLIEALQKVSSEPEGWNLSRDCQAAIRKIKQRADKAAHSRYRLTKESDLTEQKEELRDVVEQLVHISGLQVSK